MCFLKVTFRTDQTQSEQNRQTGVYSDHLIGQCVLPDVTDETEPVKFTISFIPSITARNTGP